MEGERNKSTFALRFEESHVDDDFPTAAAGNESEFSRTKPQLVSKGNLQFDEQIVTNT